MHSDMQPSKARHPLWARGSTDAADDPPVKERSQRSSSQLSPAGRKPALWQQHNHKSTQPAATPNRSSPAHTGQTAATPGHARNSHASAATPKQPAGSSELLKKQFMCRMHLSLLDACYNAVLMHQELQQQGMLHPPAPMFPMEKLLESFRER